MTKLRDKLNNPVAYACRVVGFAATLLSGLADYNVRVDMNAVTAIVSIIHKNIFAVIFAGTILHN